VPLLEIAYVQEKDFSHIEEALPLEPICTFCDKVQKEFNESQKLGC
jgi:hypothetical protein